MFKSARFCHVSGNKKLSNATTECPRLTSSLQRFAPTKPAAPVTKHFTVQNPLLLAVSLIHLLHQ